MIIQYGNKKRHGSTQDGAAAGTVSLASLFITFLKIGLTAFGGFMALISVVQSYVVERKKLLKQEDVLDGISLATILPGPVAVNVVAYVGYRLRGGAGAFVSSLAVILPAFMLILGLSYAYFTFGQIPRINMLFQGFIPAVTAIIAVTAWNMASKAVKGRSEAAIALSAFLLLLIANGFALTIGIIMLSGLSGYLLYRTPEKAKVKQDKIEDAADTRNCGKPGGEVRLHSLAAPFAAVFVMVPAAVQLLVVFGGMSLLLFGGGYVFIPLMERVVVDGYGWVTRQEFVDAIALGQVTPGPILISAAFIGYKAAGLAGAASATIGIFTPPAVVMLICTRYMDRIKSSEAIKAALRGIRPAVIGMIAAAAVAVLRTAPMNLITVLILIVSLAALVRFKIETALIIPGAGILGLLLY